MEIVVLNTVVPLWQLFAGVGVLLCVAEIAGGGFILLPLGLATLLTAVYAIFILNLPLLFIGYFINSVIIYYLFRKFVQQSKGSEVAKTNMQHLIGQNTVVDEEIDNNKNSGYARIYGDSWRVVSKAGEVIGRGEKVTVVAVDGNKLIVMRKVGE